MKVYQPVQPEIKTFLSKIFPVIAFLLLFTVILHAQQNDTKVVINEGKVSGLIYDKIHKRVLQAATVSIYDAKDMKLLSFQLTNNWGKFNFDNIPANINLKLVASNIGYKATVIDFEILNNKKIISFDTIVVEYQTKMLNEVTISEAPPPLQMKGDTLEFNASAFKSDANAVVGDLLKKLPGVTVWNDGVITVNGKKINKLFVEGKEFFGGNINVAINNIPKDAVKKIQVYEDKNDPNPVEKSSNMNIVLGKNKKDGYFGKVGAGIGNGERRDVTGLFNYFSTKRQIVVGGVHNNVNKIANSLNDLTYQASYKIDDLNDNYTSDFRRNGQTKYSALGASGEFDFEDHANNPLDSNILKGNYFFNNAESEVKRNAQSVTTLDDKSSLYQNSEYRSYMDAKNHGFDGKYARKYKHISIGVAGSVDYQKSDDQYVQNSSTYNSMNIDTSESNDQQNRNQEAYVVDGGFNLKTERYTTSNGLKHHSLDMDLSYSVIHSANNSVSTRLNTFYSNDSTKNHVFDRLYQIKSTDNLQNLSSNIRNINSLWKRAPFLEIDLLNQFTLQNSEINNIVSNKVDEKYQVYSTLTDVSKTKTWTYQPAINFSKILMKKLDGRYIKNWNFAFMARFQIFSLENVSQKVFQNISRRYSYFIPAVSINKRNEQLGEFVKIYLFDYKTYVRYPSVQDLVPLIDDINVYKTEIGNSGLKPAFIHDFSFRYLFNNRSPNELRNEIKLGTNVSEQTIIDNEFIDNIGRSFHYLMNGSSTFNCNIYDKIQKSFKLKNNQLQFLATLSFNYAEIPFVQNNMSHRYIYLYGFLFTEITYTIKDIFLLKVGEEYRPSKTQQRESNDYNVSHVKLFINSSVAITPKVRFHTNADFNSVKSNYTPKHIFTILNADVSYRFLKGANAELKFSALDLLHQNRNLVNVVSGNRLSSQVVNTLQQYFMLSVSYFPRKFGLNKEKL